MRVEPEGYDQFWEFWRQHRRRTDGRNKDKVQQRYQEALNAGATPEDILLAAQCHIRKLREKGEIQFIELAATWLHSECWKDEVEEQREYLARRAAKPSNVVSIQVPTSKFLQDFYERKRMESQ